MVAAWDRTVAAYRRKRILKYFGWECAAGEVDSLASALAANLQRRGIAKGDRVALYLQNVPYLVVSVLACWKIGAVATLINPMYKSREVRSLVEDCGARLIIGHYANLHAVRDALDAVGLLDVIAASSLGLPSDSDDRGGSSTDDQSAGSFESLDDVLEAHRGQSPESTELLPDDVATILYTSGTTGPAKGAVSTHRNLVAGALMFQRAKEIASEDVIFAIAPLCHTTGLVGHLALSIVSGARLVLSHRFHPVVAAEQIHASQATYTIGAITAYISMLNSPDVTQVHLASLKKVYAGGAPIPGSVLRDFEAKFGLYIRNGYGMTEASPAVLVPLHRRAPVDGQRGVVAIGMPVLDTEVAVWNSADDPLPPGEEGELVIRGPQVIPGYWGREEESANLLRKGWLHTGDVGYADADGWLYLVDRIKDVIIASGYKIWPREVEEVLYEHADVREAAVIGVPDAYRGETVVAYVALRRGGSVLEADLITFCAERMAAYKYPRGVVIIDDLPKSENGKIMRRELRAMHRSPIPATQSMEA